MKRRRDEGTEGRRDGGTEWKSDERWGLLRYHLPYHYAKVKADEKTKWGSDSSYAITFAKATVIDKSYGGWKKERRDWEKITKIKYQIPNKFQSPNNWNSKLQTPNIKLFRQGGWSDEDTEGRSEKAMSGESTFAKVKVDEKTKWGNDEAMKRLRENNKNQISNSK